LKLAYLGRCGKIFGAAAKHCDFYVVTQAPSTDTLPG